MLEYFERNAVAKPQTYLAGLIAPHGETQRWAYTVPAGKFAKIESIMLRIFRDVASGTVGRALADIRITRNGTERKIARIEVYSTSVGAQDNVHLSNFGVLLAGETIAGITYDESTGGSCHYMLGANITEFS